MNEIEKETQAIIVTLSKLAQENTQLKIKIEMLVLEIEELKEELKEGE